MKARLLPLLAAVLVLFASQAAVSAQQRDAAKSSIEQLMESMARVRGFREVVISPDGRHVAWTQSVPGKGAGPGRSLIHVAAVPAGSEMPHRLSAGGGGDVHDEHGLAWSPDGSRLAFLSDRDKKGQLQLYVADVTGTNAAKKLTSLTGFLSHPQWSPDGKKIAFLFIENAARAAGPVQPGARETGVIEERVYEQRLTTIDADGGNLRPVSPADMYVYEYDWSPDSDSFAVTAAHGSGDNNWYLAQLYTLAAGSGAMKSIFKPSIMQIAEPHWSPDGKSVAVIGGLMSDEGSTGGDVFSVPVDGGSPRNLTPGIKTSPSWLSWTSSGHIVFAEHVDGGSGVAELDPETAKVETLWTGDESISGGQGIYGLSLVRDGKTSALVRQSFAQPPEVWAGATGAWKQLTHANSGLRRAWGDAKSLHWKSDEFTIQGWLLYPRDYDPARRYPMIVSIHGGPAATRTPAWGRGGFDTSLFAAEGYFVLYPNPRGSFGQGQAFTRANVKDFGYGDLRDIMAGVDEVLRTLPVDKDRLAVMGGSYGGYMTMWAVTQTTRFRAAVALAGVSNWQSYYGENGIDQWMIPYFGASVYDDPAVYAKSSPINFIKRVKTPTLIMVGERDLECPPPQSYEFWHALKTLGVPTQLVIYKDEGHGFSQPEHRRDAMRRTAAWVTKYLAETTPAGGAPGNASGAGRR